MLLIPHKNKKTALALSGGGSRGAIHLGVLKAFDENGIKIEAISGTSIGAIIGVLYSSGMSPEEIKKTLNTKTFRKVFHLSWSKKGLLKMDKLLKLLGKLVGHDAFEELNNKFYCCVSNLNQGNFEIISSGELLKPVIASASIPVIFEPVVINGEYYIDGGLFNNLPVEPLVEQDYFVIGVHVNNYKPPEDITAKTAAERIFTQVIKMNVKPKMEMCDVVIDPYIPEHVGVLDFSKTDYLFDLGYIEAMKYIEKLKLFRF
ncbi:MAG: hypothetical protein GXO47_12150 [Chlorobi bacterium]|nr:hypothetical protein [Chlorobiota bacterium]